jgi:hypothetical protein
MKLRRLSKLIITFALASLCVAAAQAQDGASHRRAQEVLGQSRAALGGEAKLNAVKSFSIAWKFRRVAGNGEQDKGETQFDFLLPDKFLKREVLNLSGEFGQVTSLSGMSGEQVWTDFRTNTQNIPVVDEGAGNPEKQAALRQGLRKELTLNLLQLMLTPPASWPVEFIHVGEAEAEDGRADVLEGKAPNGFTVRLFIDKETHHLRLLSYREATVKVTLPASKEVKKNVQLQYKPVAADAEVRLRFADYRPEEGIIVPHLVTREKNGKIVQEAELKSFKVNPSYKAEYFEAKIRK